MCVDCESTQYKEYQAKCLKHKIQTLFNKLDVFQIMFILWIIMALCVALFMLNSVVIK